MTAETGQVRRAELEREQDYLTRLYKRLDALRDQTRARLTEVRRRGATGTHQQRSERDAFNGMYEARLAQLNAVESGLAFGRLDMSGGDRHYIGRMGLTDEGHDTLLVDWRAPVAEPFYRATPANPHRVIRRRHLRTRGRSLLDVEDDVFDLDTPARELILSVLPVVLRLSYVGPSKPPWLAGLTHFLLAEAEYHARRIVETSAAFFPY